MNVTSKEDADSKVSVLPREGKENRVTPPGFMLGGIRTKLLDGDCVAV